MSVAAIVDNVEVVHYHENSGNDNDSGNGNVEIVDIGHGEESGDHHPRGSGDDLGGPEFSGVAAQSRLYASIQLVEGIAAVIFYLAVAYHYFDPTKDYALLVWTGIVIVSYTPIIVMVAFFLCPPRQGIRRFLREFYVGFMAILVVVQLIVGSAIIPLITNYWFSLSVLITIPTIIICTTSILLRVLLDYEHEIRQDRHHVVGYNRMQNA